MRDGDSFASWHDGYEINHEQEMILPRGVEITSQSRYATRRLLKVMHGSFVMTERKIGKRAPSGGPFGALLARFGQPNTKELQEAYETLKREEEEVHRYAREREASIRRGARRTGQRFRP